jgi:hypothetical protein
MHIHFIFLCLIDLFFGVLTPLSAIFQLYHGDSFSGGGSRSTGREPQLIQAYHQYGVGSRPAL